MSAAAVKTRLGEAGAQVEAARAALAEGRIALLDGLNEKVDGVCRDLAALPAAEAKPLQADLLALFDGLNALAEALKREHDGLRQALGDLGAQRRARAAYGKTGRGS